MTAPLRVAAQGGPTSAERSSAQLDAAAGIWHCELDRDEWSFDVTLTLERRDDVLLGRLEQSATSTRAQTTRAEWRVSFRVAEGELRGRSTTGDPALTFVGKLEAEETLNLETTAGQSTLSCTYLKGETWRKKQTAEPVDARGYRERTRQRLAQIQPAGDGVLKDGGTGLSWTSADSGEELDWASANAYCERLERATLDDWRLPSLDELERLYMPDLKHFCGERTCKMHPGFQLTGNWIWSSTKKDPSGAYYFSFYAGRAPDSADWLYLDERLRVLCVHPSGT